MDLLTCPFLPVVQVLEDGGSSVSLGSFSQEEKPHQEDLPRWEPGPGTSWCFSTAGCAGRDGIELWAPACRLFLVHGDGSAVELLSSQTVEEVLRQACSDPAAVLLKEPLPDCPGSPFCCPEASLKSFTQVVSFPDEFAVTVLKPGHRSLWSRWIMGKRAPDITPQNLRNRSWAHFPQTEVRAWGQGRRASPRPGP